MTEDHTFWVGVASAAGWVAMRHKAKSYSERLLVVAISVGLGLALYPDLAAATGRSDGLAVVTIILAIWILLDVATSIVTDADLKKAVMDRIARGK